MQPLSHEPEIIRGIEVLSFEGVELEKIRNDGVNSFGTAGKLNVLYFDYYERFVLMINNWKYALTPRIPVLGHSNNPTPIYTLPAIDGEFNLKLNGGLNEAALQNLLTIFQNSTRYGEFRERANLLLQQTGALIQESHQTFVSAPGEITTVNTKEIIPVQASVVEPIGEVRNYPSVAVQREGYSTGYLQRTGQVTNIGNTTYPYNLMQDRKTKKTTGFRAQIGRLISKKKEKRENPNMTQITTYERLRRSNEVSCPIHEFSRQEIELTVVGARQIAKRMEKVEPKDLKEKATNIVDAIKEGAREIKEAIHMKLNPGPNAHAPPTVREILREGLTEIKENLHSGGSKLSLGLQVSTIMEGIGDIKYKLATRNYRDQTDLIHGGEPATQQKPGKVALAKEIASEIKGIVSSKIHDLRGTEPLPEGQKGPGLMDHIKTGVASMKLEAHNFKERVVLRAHIAEGTIGEEQRPSMKSLVKEAVHEIKDRMDQKHHFVDKNSEDILVNPLLTVNLQDPNLVSSAIPGRVISVEPITRSTMYHTPGKPKILERHTPSSEIKDPVTIVYSLERYHDVPGTDIAGLTPNEVQVHSEVVSAARAKLIMERINAGLPLEDIENLPPNLGNTLSDKVKNFVREGFSCGGTTASTRHELVLGNNSAIAETGSPVKKRELLKAALPVYLNKVTDGQVPKDHATFSDVVKSIPVVLHLVDQSNIKPKESDEMQHTLMNKVRSKMPFLKESNQGVIPDVHSEPAGFVAGGIDELNHKEYHPSLFQKVKSMLTTPNRPTVVSVYQSSEVQTNQILNADTPILVPEVTTTQIMQRHPSEDFCGTFAESHDTFMHKDFEMVSSVGRNLESHLLQPKGGETCDMRVYDRSTINHDNTAHTIRPTIANSVYIPAQTTTIKTIEQDLSSRKSVEENLVMSEVNVYQSLAHYEA